MTSARRRFTHGPASEQGVLARLLAPPDEVMLEHGAGGELLVAKARAMLSILVLALPLLAGLRGIGAAQTMIGLGLAVLLNLVAQAWLALARSHRRYRWLPYASATWDVTSTTGVAVLLSFQDPIAGIGNAAVLCFYTLTIFTTSLRNDGRLVLYAGALAIAQHGLLATAILLLAPGPLMSIEYGHATFADQAGRLVLIALATMLTGAVVYRMQRMIELSGHDGLTGLPNRAWLLQHLPRMFQSARDGGHSLTLALVDLDRFKRLNDDFGHQAGNRALRRIASQLGEMLENKEALARIGGQEFVIVMRSPIGSAWERLDRTRRMLLESPFQPERGNEAVTITFSAGLAAFPQDGVTASALLGVADRRLQVAKREGRNRIVALDP